MSPSPQDGVTPNASARARRAATDLASSLGWRLLAPLQLRRRSELARCRDLRRILVLNDVRGIGNLVMLSGLLLNLRRLYPGAHIAVAMPQSSVARTVLGPELADELLFCDTERRGAWLPFAWRTLRPRRFDLGLGTFFSDTLLTSVVLLLAGCKYRVAYGPSERRGFLNTVTLVDHGGHELDRHLRLIELCGEQFVRQTHVAVRPEAARFAEGLVAERALRADRPLLGVHPGCDRINPLKRWPAERFAAVARTLVAEDLADVLVFLGPDDADLASHFPAETTPHLELIRDQPLERVAALIAKCDLFLSNDSGLMHVAAALGVPVVGIFGPTQTEKNAPVGSAVLLTASGVECRPCSPGGIVSCHRDRQHCLKEISVAQVVGTVGERLRSVLPPRIRAAGVPEPLRT